MLLFSLNTPVTLTLIRLISSPLVLPVAFIYLLPYNNAIINVILALLFLCLGLTDFFDGYLARKYNQVTFWGKALDPLADKFLLFSSLVALLVIKKIFFLWVIVFIGREFFVMGLRILALEQGFDVPVGILGKLKTVAQFSYITMVILNIPIVVGYIIIDLETIFLYTALILSLTSAVTYTITFVNNLHNALPFD